MDETIDTLRAYVDDRLAVERDIHPALRRHREDRGVSTYPDAVAVLQQIEDRVDLHVASLQRRPERDARDAWRVGDPAGTEARP